MVNFSARSTFIWSRFSLGWASFSLILRGCRFRLHFYFALEQIMRSLGRRFSLVVMQRVSLSLRSNFNLITGEGYICL
jgi:hypothetical protein